MMRFLATLISITVCALSSSSNFAECKSCQHFSTVRSNPFRASLLFKTLLPLRYPKRSSKEAVSKDEGGSFAKNSFPALYKCCLQAL